MSIFDEEGNVYHKDFGMPCLAPNGGLRLDPDALARDAVILLYSPSNVGRTR